MKTQIVIARYNENIEWIKFLNPALFDVIIYNKGDKLNETFDCKIINLDNVGRESHTYLHHIISNYENLPEKIIFTQAHPFDHVNNLFENIYNYEQNTYDFVYFSKNLLRIQFDESKNKFIEYGILNGSQWLNYHDINFTTVLLIEKLFGSKNNNELNILFGTGAIFGVNKKTIMNKNKDFYSKCINILNTSSNLTNPVEGHGFERLWFYIFNNN
jgi:hypothetical protein